MVTSIKPLRAEEPSPPDLGETGEETIDKKKKKKDTTVKTLLRVLLGSLAGFYCFGGSSDSRARLNRQCITLKVKLLSECRGAVDGVSSNSKQADKAGSPDSETQ